MKEVCDMQNVKPRVQVVIRVGDREEVIGVATQWDQKLLGELTSLHGLDVAWEFADCLAQQVIMNVTHDNGKAVREAILRMVDYKPEPMHVVGE
jgi:hypothetical protein